MNRYKKIILGILLCSLSLASVSCKKEKSEEKYHGVAEKIEAQGKKYHGVEVSSDKLLEDKKLIEITEGEHTFLIPERKGEIKLYACSECHSEPLTEMQKNSEKGKKAHWDIKLEHANEKTMNCKTCHTGDDMNNLHSLTNEPIDFNASYNLCAQCHSSQFKDWKGGAHGKKVAGWAPPRASRTCVNCHNPHSPSFKSKWPARFNTKTAEERNEKLGH